MIINAINEDQADTYHVVYLYMKKPKFKYLRFIMEMLQDLDWDYKRQTDYRDTMFNFVLESEVCDQWCDTFFFRNPFSLYKDYENMPVLDKFIMKHRVEMEEYMIENNLNKIRDWDIIKCIEDSD